MIDMPQEEVVHWSVPLEDLKLALFKLEVYCMRNEL
jgi:hypothetical protein